MNRDNNIQEELKAMDSPLADMPRSMPYAVPEGYFEQLPAFIAQHKDAEDQIPKYNIPYTAPTGYFDGLPAQMLQAAKTSDEKQKSTATRFVAFPKMKLAMAAMLALVISFGGYMIFTENKVRSAERVLASIPNNEINEYIQHNGIDINNSKSSIDISNLNVENKDIVAYLNETGWE